MFATLVVSLPCEDVAEGGELVVSHRKEQSQFAVASNAQGFECFGFFCNCLHEIKPLRGGRRLTLVFNVIADDHKIHPPSDGEMSIVERTEERLNDILMKKRVPHRSYFALVLEHAYSQQALQALGKQALKGSDAALADALSKLDLVDFAVGTLSIEGSRESDATPDWGYKRGRYGYSRYEREEEKAPISDLTELEDVSYTLSSISPLQGDIAKAFAKKDLAMDPASFLIPLEIALEDAEADVSGGEYTGNYAEPFAYHYSTTAMVMWTNEDLETALVSLGFHHFVSLLEVKLNDWRSDKTAGAKREKVEKLLNTVFQQKAWEKELTSSRVVVDAICELGDEILVKRYLGMAEPAHITPFVPLLFKYFDKELIAELLLPKVSLSSWTNGIDKLCVELFKHYAPADPEKEKQMLMSFRNVLLLLIEKKKRDYSSYGSSGSNSDTITPEALLDGALARYSWEKLQPSLAVAVDGIRRVWVKQNQTPPTSYEYYPHATASNKMKQIPHESFLAKLVNLIPTGDDHTWLSGFIRECFAEWKDFSDAMTDKLVHFFGKTFVSDSFAKAFLVRCQTRGSFTSSQLADQFLVLARRWHTATSEVCAAAVQCAVSEFKADESFFANSILVKLAQDDATSDRLAKAIVSEISRTKSGWDSYHFFVGILRQLLRPNSNAVSVSRSAAFVLINAADEIITKRSISFGETPPPNNWTFELKRTEGLPQNVIGFLTDPAASEMVFRFKQATRDRLPVKQALLMLQLKDLSVQEAKAPGKDPFTLIVRKTKTKYTNFIEGREAINRKMEELKQIKSKFGWTK